MADEVRGENLEQSHSELFNTNTADALDGYMYTGCITNPDELDIHHPFGCAGMLP